MHFVLPSETIFHTIERSVKEYRKFAQKRLMDVIPDLTLDQAMVLLFLDRYPDLSQTEVADLVFRDNASMTRMINLMVKKKYLKRSINEQDRRRFHLAITPKGKDVLDKLPPLISSNRARSLEGISQNELKQVSAVLKKIIANCA